MWQPPDMQSRSSACPQLGLTVVVHDFSGHPGQLKLSRELARRGYTVQHHFCESFTTGQGATSTTEADPVTFSVRGIRLSGEFARYSAWRRIIQEIKYGFLTVRATWQIRPDLVICSNLPLISLMVFTVALKLGRIPYIFWWQDIYSDAINTVARQRLGMLLGGAVGWLVGRMERACARRASAIVPISKTFLRRLDDWGIDRDRATVIPNWGVLDDLDARPRENQWSDEHGLAGCRVVMYAGTLGLKHDPSTLARLAQSVPDDCRVVVVSQGIGREWLEEHADGDPRLVLLDYQPYEVLPDMLASADVLVAILEQDASRYSVPSKVLNYLCAGRPVVAVMPVTNPAAEMITAADAGIVIGPENKNSIYEVMESLLTDSRQRIEMGKNARKFAEMTFDIAKIADTFEAVVLKAVTKAPPGYTSDPRTVRTVNG